MATNNTPPVPEEVDLGQLFKVIGNGFRNFFNAIGNFIKKLFHYAILAILFVKKNIVLIGIVTLLGGILGYVLDMNAEPVYISNMVIKTNYGSAKRLHNQKKYISTLVNTEDTTTLAKYFNISPTNAATLLGFEIEPFEKDKNLLLEYDYFMERRDTNYVKEFDFKDFAKRTTENDLRFQKVTFYAKDQVVFPKLAEGLKKGVENEFYKKLRDKSVSKLKLKRKRLERDLVEIDSLRENYRKVNLIEAGANPGGSNINLSTKNLWRNNNDISLFKSSKEILTSLEKLKQEEDRTNEIATIISNFNTGSEFNEIKYKKWFRYAILGFLLASLFILAKQFNTYLNNYNKD